MFRCSANQRRKTGESNTHSLHVVKLPGVGATRRNPHAHYYIHAPGKGEHGVSQFRVDELFPIVGFD